MTTREELQQKAKEREKLVRRIDLISKNLEEGELSLRDIDSEQERLQEATQELNELMEAIIELRFQLTLEESEQMPIF